MKWNYYMRSWHNRMCLGQAMNVWNASVTVVTSSEGSGTEHQVLVLFQLLPSPHQGREERWPLHRLFQGPPPEEACRPLPVAHIPSSAQWYHPDVVGAAQLPFVRLGVGLIRGWIGSAKSCCDRNYCRIRSFSFLISSINSSRILVFIWVSLSFEEDDCRCETPKYSLIPTPCPAARTRPQCSGRPIVSTRISWRPSGTKLPWDSKESCERQKSYQFLI